MATITQETTPIPAVVEVPGEQLFRVLVRLLRAEEALMVENDRCETPAYEELDDALVLLYHAAFGDIFADFADGHDLPEPECFMPVYRLALEEAKAEPVKTESQWAEVEEGIASCTRHLDALLGALEARVPDAA